MIINAQNIQISQNINHNSIKMSDFNTGSGWRNMCHRPRKCDKKFGLWKVLTSSYNKNNQKKKKKKKKKKKLSKIATWNSVYLSASEPSKSNWQHIFYLLIFCKRKIAIGLVNTIHLDFHWKFPDFQISRKTDKIHFKREKLNTISYKCDLANP